ncbi:MAG: acetylornithine deacetylase [Paracoccaceae bacterium]
MDRLAETEGLLAELIAFPTVSADSNLELISWAAGGLGRLGARTRITTDESGRKANLFASFGPQGDGGLVLSGHSDVVPVEDQDWSVEPFALTAKEDRLLGRGTCDMKGFIAAVLATAPDFAAARLSRPLHVALTYDEEVGCLGARTLVEDLRREGIRPAAAIIGEPTSMQVIEGHKGCREYTTEFAGLEGHGSAPDRGVNAVEYAVRYAARLMEIAEALKAAAPEGSRFVPPWTTLQIGRLQGGVAHNVIPGTAELDWEMRPVVETDAETALRAIDAYAEETLLPAMRAVSPAAAIRRRVVGEVAGLEPAEENEARRIVSALTGANEAGVVAFGTEAGLFAELGMACVVCGPGSIRQAHKPDEYVERAQLSACLDMLEGLARRLSA